MAADRAGRIAVVVAFGRSAAIVHSGTTGECDSRIECDVYVGLQDCVAVPFVGRAAAIVAVADGAVISEVDDVHSVSTATAGVVLIVGIGRVAVADRAADVDVAINV